MDGTVNISIKDFESFKECDRMYRELLQELQKRESCIKIVSKNESYGLIPFGNSRGNGYYAPPANTTTHTYFITNDSTLKEIESHYQVEMAKKQNEVESALKYKEDDIMSLNKRLEDMDSYCKRLESTKQKKKWYQIF